MDHQRLVAVWQPGSGIAVYNVKCEVFHLFVCLFHNPILGMGKEVVLGLCYF